MYIKLNGVWLKRTEPSSAAYYASSVTEDFFDYNQTLF